MEYQDAPANPVEYLPQRTQTQPHYCHCLLANTNGEPANFCRVQTGGPDEPFCDQCDTRHPGETLGVIITTYVEAEYQAWLEERTKDD